jgi:transaldolase
MKSLFLDTANLEEITQMVKTHAIAGVTTNPSLMAKEQKGDYVKKLSEICLALEEAPGLKHLSVEVTTSDPSLMVSQAGSLIESLKDFEIDLYVKIPVMLETLPVISALTDMNIQVNATACMTAMQAKLAEDAGAPIVSFFYNRMIDGFRSGKDEIHSRIAAAREIVKFVELRQHAEIICGSIRKPEDVLECWSAGAEIVTASTKVIKGMISHPKTDEAIKQFQEDIDAWLK